MATLPQTATAADTAPKPEQFDVPLSSNRRIQQASRTGLEASLTSAVALADLLGADEIVTRLLEIKRDVVNTEADDDDLIAAVQHTFGASAADCLREIRAGR